MKGCVAVIKTKWTEAAIREELAKLDEKTGLHGAELPISFGNAQYTLGMYSSRNGGSFRFSNYYYQDPNWPDEAALETIRHEYAHYMDHMLYGNFGHGSTWKRCCRMIGARPARLYSNQEAEFYRKKHAEEAKLSARFDSYRVGSRLEHPQFGVGRIEEITGTSANRCITVNFLRVGRKRLGLAWVDKNCKRIS